MSKKNVKYPELKKSLREREHVSRSVLRKNIHEASGMVRWAAWNEKRSYGDDTRHLLLAYGFIRKMPYAACEKKCADDNRPLASAIVVAAKDHGIEIALDAVKAWLKGEEAGATPAAA